MKYLLPPLKKPLQPQTCKPKSRAWNQINAPEKRLVVKQSLIKSSKPGKKAHTENVASENDVEKEVLQSID